MGEKEDKSEKRIEIMGGIVWKSSFLSRMCVTNLLPWLNANPNIEVETEIIFYREVEVPAENKPQKQVRVLHMRHESRMLRVKE